MANDNGYTPAGHSDNWSKNQGYKPYKSRKLWVFLIGAAMVAGLGILQGATGWNIPAICYGTIGAMVIAYDTANTVQKKFTNPNNNGKIPNPGRQGEGVE